MDQRQLEDLLAAHRAGDLSTDDAVERLRHFPSKQLEDITLDTHRALRTGLPEVIYGRGKTPQQVTDAAQALAESGAEVLATRLTDQGLAALRGVFGEALVVDAVAGAAWLPSGREQESPEATVLVLCAGTSDLPVAREAAFVARAVGLHVETGTDVGVAGIHRLLAYRDRLATAGVVIAVAGMDGALPGVVAGLTRAPVIAVPTSVGYGAGAGGIAPLLTMLNACSPGVTVVNIDNGFGAAWAAWKMLHVSVGAAGGVSGPDSSVGGVSGPDSSVGGVSGPDSATSTSTSTGNPSRERANDDPTELVIECNIDDMPGTTLGDVMTRLFEAGALDVWFTPIQMKKNRPAVQLSVLGHTSDRDKLLDLVFTHTTTLGVRLRPTNRVTLDRRIDTVDTPHGPLRIKRATWQGREVNAKPEPDDLVALSRAADIPIKDLETDV